MGFDVTATHVIFFVAFLSIGSAAIGTYWESASRIEDSRRWEEGRIESKAQTNLTIENASYNADATRFSVNITNVGSTVLDMTEFEYLIDGSIVSSSLVESTTIAGVASTDLLLPTETVEIKFNPVSSSPGYFMVVAANGVRANWRA